MFQQYRRKLQISELRPYVEGEDLPSSVSISEADKKKGSPKIGDMISRNPKDHSDLWLIEAEFFNNNFELND